MSCTRVSSVRASPMRAGAERHARVDGRTGDPPSAACKYRAAPFHQTSLAHVGASEHLGTVVVVLLVERQYRNLRCAAY